MDRYDMCNFCKGYVKIENLIEVELNIRVYQKNPLEGDEYQKVSICEECKKRADTR